jgi:metal-sulfur cluster biosynthetic enzyme
MAGGAREAAAVQPETRPFAADEDERPAPAASDLEHMLWAALARVQDPELPIGIVDLGLVYGVRVEEGRAEVDLTHTAIGCPALEMMREDVAAAARSVPGIDDVCVRTVWDPPWTKARLTPRGRMALRASGISL